MPVFTYTPASPQPEAASRRRGRLTGGRAARSAPASRGAFPASRTTARNNAPPRLRGAGNQKAGSRRIHPPAGLRGWLRGRRRLAIAILLSLAAGLAVHQLTPVPTSTVTILSAARDLPAGATLGAMDLRQLRVPAELLVDGTFTELPDLVGKQLASPVLQSQILTTTQLLGQGLLAGAPEGSAAVPLRMADPASIRLLSPGQLVNIVKSSDGGYGSEAPSEVLAEGVAVLWTSGNGGQGSEWLGAGETEGLVVVAASPAQAGRLAGASSQGKLFFVMVGAGP